MRAALSSVFLLIAACEHSSPFTFVPGTQGPWGGGLPRRLTFSAGDDRNASVTGGLIVFSRLEASALATRERCLALLPVEGGTLRGEYCPRPPPALADTFLDAWAEPALSPDGHWVAYSWQQGSLVSVLGFYRTRLVVAPTAHPTDTTRFAWYINYAATAGTVTGILKPEWLDADRIRFLGADEFFFKVKGGGQERCGDTTIEWLDPISGSVAGTVISATPVRRLSAVAGTRRFVVEVERDWSPFGWPANLWLFELP